MTTIHIVRITKLKEVENPRHPNNIPEGFEKEGPMIVPPEVGERFYVGSLSTSPVQEILSGSTFRTLNSVYEWKVINSHKIK